MPVTVVNVPAAAEVPPMTVPSMVPPLMSVVVKTDEASVGPFDRTTEPVPVEVVVPVPPMLTCRGNVSGVPIWNKAAI